MNMNMANHGKIPRVAQAQKVISTSESTADTACALRNLGLIAIALACNDRNFAEEIMFTGHAIQSCFRAHADCPVELTGLRAWQVKGFFTPLRTHLEK